MLLGFFRYAGCPFCNITLLELINRYQNFANRGLRVVAFFQSPDDSIEQYVLGKQPPFPIVADPKRGVYKKYGVESSYAGAVRSLLKAPATVASVMSHKVVQGKVDGDVFLMPAQFIIGPDGTIIKAHYGTNFGDKISMIDIERLIATMPAELA